MAEKGGAFLGLLKSGGKKPKPKGEPVDDEAEGAAYSKSEMGKPLGDVVGGKPDEADEADDEAAEAEESSGHGVSFDALANALGIPQEKRASARAALKLFIKSCVRDSKKSVSYEDDYI